MLAAENGHDGVVKTLLEQGAAVNHADPVGIVKCESIFHYSVIVHSVGSLLDCYLLEACLLVPVCTNSPVMCGLCVGICRMA